MRNKFMYVLHWCIFSCILLNGSVHIAYHGALKVSILAHNGIIADNYNGDIDALVQEILW